MCEILDVPTHDVEGLQKSGLVICTPYDGDYMSAKAVKVFDKNGDFIRVTQFHVGHTTQCFNNNPISPVIKFDKNIGDRFLQKGNKIEFETVIRESKPARKPVVPPKRKPARAAAMA